VAEAVAWMLAGLKTTDPLGFDMEWNYQPLTPTRLLQFAAANGRVLLLRSCGAKRLPAEVVAVLRDLHRKKTGNNIKHDLAKLKTDFPDQFPSHGKSVSIDASFINLGPLWRDKIGTKEACGLAHLDLETMVRVLLKRSFPDQNIVQEDWSASTLSSRQVLYAASDAATTQPSGLDDAPARRETQSAWLERSLRSMMTRRINDKSIRVLAPLAHTLVILPCPCQHYTRA
jgi:hypothetical protein